MLAREVYEYAVFLCIETGEIDQFERNFLTLKFYYNECKDILPESNKKNTALGLWLLYLLTNQKQQEGRCQFHGELQRIPVEDHSDPYISVPVNLETHFVDGNYSKVLATKKSAQRDEYSFFIDKFIDAVRVELARSAEVSYKSLSISEAIEIFMLNNEEELVNLVNNQAEITGEESKFDWEIRGNRVWFIPKSNEQLTCLLYTSPSPRD